MRPSEWLQDPEGHFQGDQWLWQLLCSIPTGRHLEELTLGCHRAPQTPNGLVHPPFGVFLFSFALWCRPVRALIGKKRPKASYGKMTGVVSPLGCGKGVRGERGNNGSKEEGSERERG